MGIIIVDFSGTITAINPFALQEFGYADDELTGRPIDLLIPERFRKDHAVYHVEYFKDPKSRPMHSGKDLFAIKKDGTELPVEITLSYFNKNNEKFVMAFINNISERKQAEAEIIKLHDELESTVEQRTLELTHAMRQLEISKEELSRSLKKEKELNELKSRFVTTASHEFRTPLSTILSSAYLIDKYTTTESQPKREIHLQRIVSSVNILIDILNDFLSVGKIEEGKAEVKITRFNIKELTATIKEEIKDNLKKQQQITYRHEGDLFAQLDASFLKHIIMNLVSNASKFSSETGIIEIKTSCINNKVTLSVKDNGIGISKEDQRHLTKRFFRGTNAVNIQGTGLGLHIVSRYAELMNGTLQCKSELEKGTEFIIIFYTQKS
nr:PAS domain-containing sensor histidine kinase [Panacibacter ginsenosidivorans]